MSRYKLVFFVPPGNLESVKKAVFATGAGAIGPYTEVCFTSAGIGQFRPGSISKPDVGDRDGVEKERLWRVEEARCEVVCASKDQAVEAVRELKVAHPYEEPAYDVYKLEDI